MQDQQIDRIDFWQVPEALQVPVRAWYAGQHGAIALDGSRSVHLPHPLSAERRLKLKGAGLSGGPVQFGVYHKSGPKAPVFDYEGRMMEDVAAGHDGAFRGGASFQQAVTEYRVSTQLAALGYDVVPCLGYGRLTKGGLTSWFSLFDHEPGLSGAMIFPNVPLAEWIKLNTGIGELLFALAVRHDLIGYCWYSATPGGRRLIRDVHPFRLADPINMSQVSWVMQVFYAMHIRGNVQRLGAPAWNDPLMPPDLHVWQYRAFCPDVTMADHDELRHKLVVPYMLAPPANFSVDKLVELLNANRITAALMEACPPKFARA